MNSMVRTFAIVLAVGCSSQVIAQTAPISRTIPVTFTGVVSSTAEDTLLIRQPDGSFATYQGPLPDLGYTKGDPVTVSFNATLPTKAFYDSGVYRGQIAADGIYRIQLATAAYGGGGSTGIGAATIPDVSGPIAPADNSGQPTNVRMTILYDYNADSYSIEGSGGFTAGAYSSPGYIYDAASGSYLACSNAFSCRTSASMDPILTGLNGSTDGTQIATGNIRVATSNLTSGTGTGFFSWLFSGSWNLPQYRSGPVDVPEPGMTILFGLGWGVLVGRRIAARKRRAVA